MNLSARTVEEFVASYMIVEVTRVYGAFLTCFKVVIVIVVAVDIVLFSIRCSSW